MEWLEPARKLMGMGMAERGVAERAGATAAGPLRKGTASAPDTGQPASGWRGRALERSLLLGNAPLVFLAAWGVAAAQRHPEEAFGPALAWLGAVWGGCVALHLLLVATRFDGDRLLLPLLSLLFLIGGAYHLDLRGPATPGLSPDAYFAGVFAALALLALVTAGGRLFRRLSLLFEERVWWRIAGDRPYYESIPFHVLLVGLMALLTLLLLVRGVRSTGGSLIQVPLPGGLSFTPSEVIRLAVAFFLADYLGRHGRVLRNLRQPLGRVWPFSRIRTERRAELFAVLTVAGLYCFFFYVFHDFGPAVVIVVLTLAALFAATGRALTPLLLGAGALLAVALPAWHGFGFRTLQNRVAMWLDPWDTRFLHGDHQARILWSIASGGWFGLGPGTEDLPRMLPLAQNDAAFAGIAATMGLWTGLALLAVFAGIAWRGFAAARRAPTDRMRLLAFCLTALLAIQALWICGAMVRVFPFTGINLPFVSTGLTSMLASALALGAVWNISRSHGLHPDATEATPEVRRSIGQLAPLLTGAFALPAAGLLLYGCPWLLGDRTLVRDARGLGRAGGRVERTTFENPYLEKFVARFPRGRIFSADGKLLAVTAGPNGLTDEELARVRELSPALARAAAADRDAEGTRYYPLGAAGAHLVGWTTRGRFSAQEGAVETEWDALLRGYRPEALPFYFRTRHNPLVRPPRPQDLQLTIRTDVQRYASRRLAEAVRRAGGAGGALVLFDASTGAVLAAVTSPTFDPNGLTLERMERYVRENPRTQVLTNKALARGALFFPGSAFKIVTAGAALEEGIEGGVLCRNGRNAEAVAWSYRGRRWRRDVGKISDYGRAGHGAMDLARDLDRALAVSCNVFFAELAARLGPERLRRAMERVELRWLPPAAELAEHLPYAGFGQIDVKTSPIELAMLAGAIGMARETSDTAAVARPYWVEAVIAPGGRRREPEGIYGAPDRSPYRPFPLTVLQELRRMMVRVAEDPSGTAHAAFFRHGVPRLPGITVGGKTGTAEFEKPGGRIGRHAWFVGFARSDHEIQPRTLAFAVLVEDVRRGATGGSVCAPVARDVVAQVLPVAGQAPAPSEDGLERFYREQIRPRLGPLAPAIEWLRRLLGGA